MPKYIVCYAATLLTLLVVDGIWLGVVAKSFYQTQIGHLMAEKVNFLAAGLFYVIYPLGVVYFAASAGLESGAWRDAAIRGAIFGFVAYATYDLSNWATLKDFPAQVAVVDMLWGAALTAVAATVGMLAARNIG
jgi:uncharacterized membrane protein